MTLQDLITRRPANGRPRIDSYLERMPAAEREMAETVLREPGYSSVQVAAAMTESGYPIGRSAVQEWRRANKVGA